MRASPQPPAMRFSAELRYVLQRAFGPVMHGAPQAVDGQGVLRWAEVLDVSGRLAARTPPERLTADLGRKAAVVLLARQAALRVQAEARARHVRALADVAAEVEAPLAFLKTAAHELLGLVPAGTRRAGDVDVLLPQDDAKRFQATLLRRGWRERGLRAHAHQLAPLVEPGGGVVECHVSLPGVRLDGAAGDADFGALRAAGLLERAPQLGPSTWLPGACVLRAHVVAHGLWQHWLTPQSYPLGRLLADGLDLGLDDALEPRTYELVAAHVPSTELDTLRELLSRLRAGDTELFVPGEGRQARRMLDHVVAGASDGDYARGLRNAHTWRGFSRPSAWPRLVAAALWPAPAQLDLLYGPARGPARLWRRLRRPLDLARRALD